MIQRIQTVYLLLAIAAVFSIFLLDVAYFTDASGGENTLGLYRIVRADGEIATVNASLFPIIAISMTGALYFLALFSYRNRKRQMQFVRFSYLTAFLSALAMWYFIDQNYWSLDLPEPDLSHGVAYFLPYVGFAFSWLANRAIRKDEELVKSLDRLR